MLLVRIFINSKELVVILGGVKVILGFSSTWGVTASSSYVVQGSTIVRYYTNCLFGPFILHAIIVNFIGTVRISLSIYLDLIG